MRYTLQVAKSFKVELDIHIGEALAAGCCVLRTGDIGGAFKIDTFGQKEYMYDLSESDTRERFLGVSNRVVGGVLIHTTRAAVVGTCRMPTLSTPG